MTTPLTQANLVAHDVAGVDRNDFQRRARLLQSLWRQDHGLDCGHHREERLGSRLVPADAAAGRNFLTPGVRALVEAELLLNEHRRGPEKKLLEPVRLRGDLLSSQPMCFNLFGELALDRSLATEVARALWPDRVDHVVDVRFEWSPGRMAARYLGNKTAADAFIEYVDVDGGRSFVAIETKYHEDMKGTAGKWKDRYDEVHAAMPLVQNVDAIRSGRLLQVLLDQMLVTSMLTADDGWEHGQFVLAYPAPNTECQTVVDAYSSGLTDAGSTTFQALSLEHIIGVMEAVGRQRWIRDFRDRYLDWARVPLT